jgi:hypothetical protein
MLTKELIDKICEQPAFSPDMPPPLIVSSTAYAAMKERGWIDEHGNQTAKMHNEMTNYIIGRFEKAQEEFPDADPLDVVSIEMERIRRGE